MTLEQLYYKAKTTGDKKEADRLYRLMERLDSQRESYGKSQR